MKHGIAFAIILAVAAGCTQKQQIKVTILSDPPGGTLYDESGEPLGPCPRVIRYDLDAESIERGYVETETMTVRWPYGPEKKSDEQLRIRVDEPNRHMVFLQPRSVIAKRETEVAAPTTESAKKTVPAEDKTGEAVPTEDEPKAPDALKATSVAARIEESEKPVLKQAEWQNNKKRRSANGEQVRKTLARTSLKPSVRRKPPAKPQRRVLTLSQKQLILLDWNSSNSRGARVKDKKLLVGRGVEFDIHFPSNSPGNCALSFVSSGTGGKGTLVGTHIGAYEEFALKLTLISVNGQSDPDMSQQLVAGAVIGPTAEGRRTGYEPITLGLGESNRTVVARTSVSADEIYEIGFHVHVRNYQDWDPSGSTIVLRVEPVEEGKTAPFD